MREIKFRAWCPEQKRMFTKVLIGNTVDKNTNDYTAHCIYRDGSWYHTDELDSTVFMQYTGLKDVNGVNIYEGDIVEAHSFVFDGNERDNNFIGKIVFSLDCCFAIESDSNQYAFCETSHFDEPCIKVIGNIYENPELLK